MDDKVNPPPPLVLVVDDHQDARDMLSVCLELSGFRCVEAADGESALAAAFGLLPDVIVLDIGLPDIPGHVVFERLREAPKTRAIPVIALTGHAMPDELARLAVFDAVLVKPCNTQELLDELGRCLSSGRRQLGPDDSVATESARPPRS